jgi:hypothetical protein
LPRLLPSCKVSQDTVFDRGSDSEVISKGSNVAIGIDATQSSDFKGKSTFAASKAVDDNQNSFSHMGQE